MELITIIASLIVIATTVFGGLKYLRKRIRAHYEKHLDRRVSQITNEDGSVEQDKMLLQMYLFMATLEYEINLILWVVLTVFISRIVLSSLL